MNAAALARDVALPKLLTGQVTAIAVVVDGAHRPAWFDGLRKEVPAGPTFRRPLDAIALVRAINGEAPRSSAVLSPSAGYEVAADQPTFEASAPPTEASSGLTCPGCGGPLSAGRRGQARLTCSDRCRDAVRRQREANARRPDVGNGSSEPTPSRPSLGL